MVAAAEVVVVLDEWNKSSGGGCSCHFSFAFFFGLFREDLNF